MKTARFDCHSKYLLSNKVILLFLCLLISLQSCKKEVKQPLPASNTSLVLRIKSPPIADTIPDGGCLKIRLQQDSTPIDETLLTFNHTAQLPYLNSQDAIYFTGFGAGSLASLTCDNVACAIQLRPFIAGRHIALKIEAKKDGVYLLKLSYLKNVPPAFHCWLKDTYRKDSSDLRKWNYKFDVIKSDTNSYGSRRFSLVLR